MKVIKLKRALGGAFHDSNCRYVTSRMSRNCDCHFRTDPAEVIVLSGPHPLREPASEPDLGDLGPIVTYVVLTARGVEVLFTGRLVESETLEEHEKNWFDEEI